ncbi:5'-nucleotidase domain containing 3 [Balamuthia mandrillaris]
MRSAPSSVRSSLLASSLLRQAVSPRRASRAALASSFPATAACARGYSSSPASRQQPSTKWRANTAELLRSLRQLREAEASPLPKKVADAVLEFENSIEAHKAFVKKLPKEDACAIFTNGELRLDSLDVIGFDYDYTLVHYKEQLQNFIYQSVLAYMLQALKYPSELRQLRYDPTFAIRGLQFDIRRGNIIKMDYLNLLQADAVFCGRKPMSTKELHEAYPGMMLPRNYHDENVRSMNDIFALPETCLVADIIQFLKDQDISFDPTYVYEDMMKGVHFVHSSGLLHNEIMNNLPLYIDRSQSQALLEFLLKLKFSDKTTFLATNSSFEFVDKGMEFMLDKTKFPEGVTKWTDLFDIVLTSCNKPDFFTKNRPFRVFDPQSRSVRWERAHPSLEPGQIYVEGSLQHLMGMTGWVGDRVLYFGDHIFNDLKEPSRALGWKTGVIIEELEHEVEIQNDPKYRALVAELIEVDKLTRVCMFFGDHASSSISSLLKDYRAKLGGDLKELCHPNFGSAFRTHRNATLFAFQLQRYANIYTSKIQNFLEYPMHYSWYPDRLFLPHEAKIPSSHLWRVLPACH